LNLVITDLTLTGSQLCQRLDTYKNKYRKAKDFERNTGAGIEEQEGFASLKQKLEAICPCYNQMDSLFKEKANITAMRCLDSTSGTGIHSIGENELDDGVGNPVPLESQDSEAAAAQDRSQPWSNWMETQETPRANRTANWADDVSAEEIVMPSCLILGTLTNSGDVAQSQPQATPTAASQSPATDTNLPNEQVRSALQDAPSAQSPGTGFTTQNEQVPASSQGSTSGTAPAAPRNLVPNMHRVSSRQSAVSSVSSVSSVQSSSVQSSVSAPTGKSSGLTATYKASSMKKLTVMQSQLELDSKRYELEVQARLDEKEERKAEREELRQDRLAANEERKAERKELRQERALDCADRAADCQHQREERAEDRAEQRAICEFQEKERQERIKVASEWLRQGHSASEIQLMLQSTFGS
jgi:hypothetical protein